MVCQERCDVERGYINKFKGKVYIDILYRVVNIILLYVNLGISLTGFVCMGYGTVTHTSLIIGTCLLLYGIVSNIIVVFGCPVLYHDFKYGCINKRLIGYEIVFNIVALLVPLILIIRW